MDRVCKRFGVNTYIIPVEIYNYKAIISKLILILKNP